MYSELTTRTDRVGLTRWPALSLNKQHPLGGLAWLGSVIDRVVGKGTPTRTPPVRRACNSPSTHLQKATHGYAKEADFGQRYHDHDHDQTGFGNGRDEID